MRQLLLGFLLVTCIAGAVPAQPWKLTVFSSRTAVWVGDRFQYVVRVEYQGGVEFVADHLKKEDLNLQPFEVIEASTSTGTAAGGARFLELKLLLTTYAVNAPEVSIPPITLFYFRHARTGAKEDVPAETLIVPAFKLAVRNTVVDLSTGIRDRRPPLPILPGMFWIPAALGFCGLAAGLLYLVWRASAELRSRPWQRRQVEKDRSRRLKDAVQNVKQMRAGTPEELAAFYDRAYDALRNVASERLNQENGFTPEEVNTELRQAGDSETHADTVSELLAICDETRYAPDGLAYGRTKYADFLRKFEELTDSR